MPILPPEPIILPKRLLEEPIPEDAGWFMVYTKSRQEKKLIRLLREKKVPHYGPHISQRSRSPAGRVRTSFVPLFANYVFVRCNTQQQAATYATDTIRSMTPVVDGEELQHDLRQIRDLIRMDVPLSVEARIQPGQRVRVRNGSFAGYEGIVERRDGETRLIVMVRFMEQGISVKLEDCQLEVI